MLLKALIFACALGGSYAQLPAWGRCTNPPVKQNLNLTQLSGTWYEFSRCYAWFERGLRCNKANYVLQSAKGCTKLEAVAFRGDKEVCGEYIAYSPDPKNLAKMRLRMLHKPWYLPKTDVSFSLLETDYRTHAILHTCVDMYFMHWDIIWVNSRASGGPPAPILAKINQKVADLGFQPNKLRKTDQTRCHYQRDCSATQE